MGIAWTLPRKYFVSEKIYKKEIDRIFSSHWLHAGREEEIRRSGDFIVRRIGGNSLIILRDHDGVVRAFHNTCRHRGTMLRTEDRGRLGKTIQCPYHAWTYLLDGQLCGAPSMDRTEGFEMDDFPLHPVALQLWAGSIFINLEPDPEPFEDAFGEEPLEYFDQWRIGERRVEERIVYEIEANWKIVVQNFNECYHCPTVHPELTRRSYFESGELIYLEQNVMGGTMEITEPRGGLTLSGEPSALPLGSLAEDEAGLAHYYTLFPNTLLSLTPAYVMIYTLWPQSPGHTRLVAEWLFHPEAMADPNFDPQDAVRLWDLTNRQDWEMCELTQRGVQSQAYIPGPYDDYHEGILAAFDRRVLDALGTEPEEI